MWEGKKSLQKLRRKEKPAGVKGFRQFEKKKNCDFALTIGKLRGLGGSAAEKEKKRIVKKTEETPNVRNTRGRQKRDSKKIIKK